MGAQPPPNPPCYTGPPQWWPGFLEPGNNRPGRKDSSMRTQYIDQIVNEILIDMSHREKDATGHRDKSSVPGFEEALGELIQEEDETSRDVMRRIWNELQGLHR